jgi:hypothetical protein
MTVSLNQFQPGLFLYALPRLERDILSGMRHGNFAGQGIVPKMPMTAGGLVMAPTGNFEPPDYLPAIQVCIIHNILAYQTTSAELIIQS